MAVDFVKVGVGQTPNTRLHLTGSWEDSETLAPEDLWGWYLGYLYESRRLDIDSKYVYLLSLPPLLPQLQITRIIYLCINNMSCSRKDLRFSV